MRWWNSKFWRAARARQDPFPIRKIQSCSTAQMLGDRGAKMGDIRYRVPKIFGYKIWRYDCSLPYTRSQRTLAAFLNSGSFSKRGLWAPGSASGVGRPCGRDCAAVWIPLDSGSRWKLDASPLVTSGWRFRCHSRAERHARCCAGEVAGRRRNSGTPSV